MTTSPDTTLYLLRHGATDANERRPYILQGGGIDLPLSEIGRRQAQAVAQFLSRVRVTAVYSSKLKRACETAQAIARPQRVMAKTLESIEECHVGRWEGMDWASIEREYPHEYRAFMDEPAETPYLGGESYLDVLRRARPAIERVLEQHAGETVVVVGHNVVNRALLADLLGLHLGRARELQQANTGINVIRRRNGAAEVLTLNAHFHLHDLERPDAAVLENGDWLAVQANAVANGEAASVPVPVFQQAARPRGEQPAS
ncbi:MAG: histidine phosphatase family protein [Planctomycetes bacterium]|nr:histidine phosphatase family protein [Planctomycetota bacterium]